MRYYASGYAGQFSSQRRRHPLETVESTGVKILQFATTDGCNVQSADYTILPEDIPGVGTSGTKGTVPTFRLLVFRQMLAEKTSLSLAAKCLMPRL